MPALIKQYPNNFSINPFSQDTVSLLQYLSPKALKTFYNSQPLTPEIMLKFLKEFNFVDSHPDLTDHKRFFNGDMSKLKELLAYSADKNTWIYYNPYYPEAKQHEWHLKLSRVHQLPARLLLDLHIKNLLPIEHYIPEMFIGSYDTSHIKTCLEVMEKETIFRQRVITFLTTATTVSSSKQYKTYNINACSNTEDIVKAILQNKWASEQECVELLSTIRPYYMTPLWKIAYPNYSNILKKEWASIVSKNSLHQFLTSLTFAEFKELSPPPSKLLDHARFNPKDKESLTALSHVASQLKLALLDTAQLKFLFSKNLILPDYKSIHNYLVTKDHFERFDIWAAWLTALKPNMSPRDHKALTLYLVKQDPDLFELAGSYQNLATQVLTIVC